MQKESLLQRLFHLKERNTTVKTEIIAGITTFTTMSYILVVNPDILSQSGMPKEALFTATILASIIATLIMGLYANLPFALAPGMGLNAFFAFTVVKTMGYSWQFALTAVFLEGILFILLSLVGVREKIFNAIPNTLKKAVSVGIGLFITEIGLISANIIEISENSFTLAPINSKSALVFFIALFIMAVLSAKNVKGALLIGIVASTIIAVITKVTSLPTHILTAPPSIAPIAFKLEFNNIFSLTMFSVVFTFLFVDLFDTLGTLTGVASKAKLLDSDGKLKDSSKALFADAVGTTAGSLLGTSTVTTFVESASGVADGARTGLSAISTAFCFFISLFLFPIFSIIPPQATAAALVMVGLFMMSPILEIDFNDFTESFPAFMTFVMMPFTYSIAEGIAFGIISYTLIKLICGRRKELSPLIYILCIVFLLRMFFQ